MTVPTLSYTLWHTQRTGSTWLADVLAGTGIAGRPGEFLNHDDAAGVFAHYGTTAPAEVLAAIRREGTTPNGVFGIKQGYSEPRFSETLRAIDASDANDREAMSVWHDAFPNHRHVLLTRRNKIRLAVSWWKAIRSGEWHRKAGEPPTDVDLEGGYDAEAIGRLTMEAVCREAGIGERLRAAGIVPLVLTYEDMVVDLQRALDSVMNHLELPIVPAPASGLAVTADELSERWVQRFRRDAQRDWPNRGW